tara:strand:- start:5111 stop:7789 length:2679 start_codon:yes stop_codon:yes gene_type:complete
MAYKQYASEGNFSSFQLKTPNEVPKIMQETERRVRGLNKVNAFEQKNREIFLRAQQYAQEVEQESREQNFELETENRQQFIDVAKANMKALIKDNEKAGLRQEKNFEALTDFSKGALDAYSAIQEQRKQNRINAAGELAQITGITQDRMAAITRLDAGLTRSEFESLDFIQKLYDENTSDEVKQAYYKIYQNKGSKEYIANKYITQNTANAAIAAWSREELRLKEENPEITTEELIARLKSWGSDYTVSAIKIGDKSLSPDFVAKNYSPIFQSFMRRQEAKYQGQRELEQKDELSRQRQIGYSTVFQSEGVAGLQRLISEARTKDRRQEIAQWIINSAASQSAGSATTEDLQAFLGYAVQGMPGTPEFGRQFPEEAALVQAALRRITNQERADTQAAEAERRQGVEFKIQQKAAELFEDGIATKAEVEILQAIVNNEIGFGYESPVIKEFEKRTRFEKAKEAITEDLTLLRAQGNLTTERVLELGLPDEQQTFWLSQAKAITDFRKGPTSQAFDKQILTALKQPTEIVVSVDGRTNDSVLNMAGYYTRKKNSEFATLIAQGMEPALAGETATATVLKQLNEDLQKQGFIKNGRYTMGDRLNQQRVDAAIKLKTTLLHVKSYRAIKDKNPKTIVPHLDKTNYIGYARSMQQGAEVPQEVKVHAAEMKMTPYEWVNHLAPALGIEKIEPPEELRTWAEYIENVEPEVKNLFTVNPDDIRLQRGRAIAEGRVTTAPVRANFQSNGRELSTYKPQVSSIVFEREISDGGQPGMDIFFEDHQFPAVLPGVVKDSGYQVNENGTGYGYYLVIESVDPATGEPVDVLYGHLPRASQWELGTQIAQGQIIGEQGGTGSVQSYDGTIASIDFLAPAPRGSGSMTPYRNYKKLRESIAQQLR